MDDTFRDIVAKVENIANEVKDEMVSLRRTFHQYPELSWQEERTAAAITEILTEERFSVKNGICGTGVVAEMNGATHGKTIAVRADMDALPIQDSKEVSYASKNPGVMHACGHDCHMAMAIGAAQILKRLDFDLPGNVRFIFQPCEEATPSGAHELVQAGVMEGVDHIIALHVDPEIPAGKIGLRAGVLTAHAMEFQISIIGTSGHGARPHHAVDAIRMTSQVLAELFGIIPGLALSNPAVLSVGSVHGGTKANVLPEKVVLSGTMRTVDKATREKIVAAMEEKLQDVTKAANGTYQLELLPPTPEVDNNSDLIDLTREITHTMKGVEGVVDIEQISMGAEDFSWYLTKAPGALVRLGAKKDGDKVRRLHTDSFDVDEKALPVGAALLSLFVLKYLNGGK